MGSVYNKLNSDNICVANNNNGHSLIPFNEGDYESLFNKLNNEKLVAYIPPWNISELIDDLRNDKTISYSKCLGKSFSTNYGGTAVISFKVVDICKNKMTVSLCFLSEAQKDYWVEEYPNLKDIPVKNTYLILLDINEMTKKDHKVEPFNNTYQVNSSLKEANYVTYLFKLKEFVFFTIKLVKKIKLEYLNFILIMIILKDTVYHLVSFINSILDYIYNQMPILINSMHNLYLQNLNFIVLFLCVISFVYICVIKNMNKIIRILALLVVIIIVMLAILTIKFF